tara:strand:+ start:2324 stop:3418 length:1095 start_codon:yes stop_codon:yes gene_type:complete
MTNAVKNRVTTPERKATPLVINGDMNVAQRSTSVTGLGDGDEGYVTVDRFRHSVGAGAGRFTSKQTAVDDLDGFQNCLELDCTTADTSIAAGEFLTIDYRLEGQDLQAFKKGETNAEYYTLAFYAKADAAVTYGIELRDHDNGRHITSTFTTGTDWTHHVISFPGDTTGNFSDDNGESLRIRLWLHAGSTYNGGTAPTSWASQSNANSVSSSNGSFFASTDRSLKITGFQLEVGDYNASTLPPFQYESVGVNLSRCQRYFYRQGNEGNYHPLGSGVCESGTSAYIVIDMPTKMRTGPSAAFSGDGNLTLFDGDTFNTSSTIGSTVSGSQKVRLSVTPNSSVANGHGATLHVQDSTSFADFDSEI